MKKLFELIEYNGIPYPEGYSSKIKEVAGHLDKEDIENEDCYSLHTEYSYGKRKLNSKILEKHPILKEANKDGVPQLWKSAEWAKELGCVWVNGEEIDPNKGAEFFHLSISSDGKLSNVPISAWVSKQPEFKNIKRYVFADYIVL